jgi:hypothetical protein
MDLDINKILQNIIAKKNIFLAVVVVLIFLISGIALFGDYSTKATSYKLQNQKKSEKIERITEYNKSNEDFKKFISSVPKPLGADELVSQVEDYAVQNHINISNVSSTSMQKNAQSQTLSMDMHFNIRAKNFKDLVSFFHMVEAAYSFKIQAWSGRKADPTGAIDCDLTITSTQLNI